VLFGRPLFSLSPSSQSAAAAAAGVSSQADVSGSTDAEEDADEDTTALAAYCSIRVQQAVGERVAACWKASCCMRLILELLPVPPVCLG